MSFTKAVTATMIISNTTGFVADIVSLKLQQVPMGYFATRGEPDLVRKPAEVFGVRDSRVGEPRATKSRSYGEAR